MFLHSCHLDRRLEPYAYYGSGGGSVFLYLDGRNRLMTAGQAQQTEVTASVESFEEMEGVWESLE